MARSLFEGTHFLFADEMSTMLDVITQAQIWNLMLKEVEERRLGLHGDSQCLSGRENLRQNHSSGRNQYQGGITMDVNIVLFDDSGNVGRFLARQKYRKFAGTFFTSGKAVSGDG